MAAGGFSVHGLMEQNTRNMKLAITPVTISEAKRFVARWHRHNVAPTGALCAVACSDMNEGEVVGVGTLGRPVARHLQDGWTAEITRVCLKDEGKYLNAASMIYGRLTKLGFALGYTKIITYTLVTEKGISLRAANFEPTVFTNGGSWDVPSRPRVDKHDTRPKLRWEITVKESK